MSNISVEGAVGARAGATSRYGSVFTKSLRLRNIYEGSIRKKLEKQCHMKNHFGP
jgi:hypothetical protein